MSQATEHSGVPADRQLDWGAARTMNALEALMWRAEADPRLRSTVCALEPLDRVPDWERFLAAHDWASRMVPRFRQRVVEPALELGPPAWAVDPDFDLSYHVRRVAVPAPGGWRALLDACQQIAMTPFDRSRSPWEAVLFEGLEGDRAAYLLKMHHSTTDGMGGIQLLSQLHSRTAQPSPGKPQPDAPAPEAISPGSVLANQLAREARESPRNLGRAARALRGLGRPDRALADAARFGTSLRRVLSDPEAGGSPLLAGRSLSWRFDALDIPFAELRGASKAAGGSLNDAFLAGLLGAFRIYHRELGAEVESIPVAIPISVRSDSDAEGGNQFAGARLALPVAVADPRERIRRIGEVVRGARGEPALNALGFIAPALSRLPGGMISRLAGSLTKANDLQASNVPGIREPVYLAGARIERMYGFGPLPGCASMVTLVTHGDVCCIGVNVDPAAITLPELFGQCLEEGFAEVLALNPDGGTAVRRTSPHRTQEETMSTTDFELDGARGRVVLHTWPNDDARFVAVLAHGYGEHALRYDHVAQELVGAGAAVYAPDHLGHGASEGERALVENVEDIVDDLELAFARATADHPGLPIVLIGHSMGGIIATRYAQRHGDELAALVLSGPAVGGNPDFETLLAMDPIPEIPIDPEALSRDPAVGQAYEEDPLVYHGPFQRATLEALFSAIGAIAEGPGLGSLPTFWIHGSDDAIVPLEATRAAFEHLRGDAFEERVYQDARHEIFNETNKDEVLGDMLGFIQRALAESPARA
jgi:WS/DGAT/MGAT family acyltransferase